MGNDYFQFKQFEVKQAKAAMKVCTDACLFGALLPVLEIENALVLDIGTGTGLLSLMYAQRAPSAHIDALEIDGAAYEQAKENFDASPWPRRLKAIEGDFRVFTRQWGNEIRKYDVIFSNPPFFEGDLKSVDAGRNKALHSTELSFNALVENAAELLMEDGIFAVLVPYSRRSEMTGIARDRGLFIFQEYLVAHTALHDYFRVIQLFSNKMKEPKVEELFIRDLKQQYSLKFRELLSPFYLYL